MAKWILTIMVCVSLSFGAIGCVSSIDPETGTEQVNLDPNTVADLQKMGETASTVLSILSFWWPFLLPIAGYVGGAVRVSKKLTPQLTQAQSESLMYHTAASATAIGIEEFKKEFPDEWAKLEPELNAAKDKLIKPEDRLRIENIIRGLRGLPPKE